MRLLILGGNGMLGHKLVQVLGKQLEVWTSIRGRIQEIEHFGIFDPKRTIEDINVTDPAMVRKALELARPDVVVNAVGIVKQIPTSKDIVHTLLINSVFPHQLADLSREFRFRLISISTDCVFDGKKGGYGEEDETNATDLYGRTKSLGEITGENCLTIRTSIIGRELSTAHSLVEWFLSNRGKTVSGFVNAIYSGFPTIVFADIITDLILDQTNLSGLFHVSSNPISKFQLLNLLNQYYNAGVEVEPSEDFRIDRRLDSTKFKVATGFAPQAWEEMIERMAADPTPYDKWHV